MGSSKLFKRLGITLTGIVMAIGVGVGLSQRGEYKEARAAEQSVTFNLTGTTNRTTVSQALITYQSGDVYCSIIRAEGKTRVDNYCPSPTSGGTDTSSHTRVYNGNSIEFGVGTGYVITKIDISCDGNKPGGLSTSGQYSPSATITGSSPNWTASFAAAVRSKTVTATTNATGYVKSFTIYYDSASLDPSVDITSSESSKTISKLKGDTDTGVQVTLSNITTPSWTFTFDEGGDEGKASSSYIRVAQGQPSNGVYTLTINLDAVHPVVDSVRQNTVIHISVSGTACSDTISVTVNPKPAAGTMVAKLNGVTIDGAVEVPTNSYRQFTFAAEDTDGNAYSIKAADLDASIISGDSFASIRGSTGVNGDAVGSATARFALKVLASVYVDVEVNVLDDYLVSVNSVTYNNNLAASQGGSPTTAIFATRTGNTYFGSTDDIPLENFLFSYTNSYVSGQPASIFSYDFSHGETVDATHKTQTIYVFCTLGSASCNSYSVTVEQVNDPLTAITLTNVTSHAQNIVRNGSFQLEWSYTPANPTDGKGVEFSVSNASSGSEISVNNTGLISAGTVPGATARITIKSDHDNTINDYVDVTVVMDEMKYTADLPEVQTPSASVAVGDRVVIVGVDKDTDKYELTGFAGASTDYGVGTLYTTSITKACAFTVEAGTANNSFAFKTSDNKYLAYVNGKNSITNASEKDEYCSWTFTNSLIQNVGNTDRYLYLNYNQSDQSKPKAPRFAGYLDKTEDMYTANFTVPTFIKITGGLTPIDVTSELYNAVCNNFGENKTYAWDAACETFKSSNWNTAGAAITGLSGYANYHLNVAVANAEGNVVQQFLAKYDVVVDKFGTTYDFLNRYTSGGIHYNERTTSGLSSSINNSSNDLTIAIIAIASVSTLAIGGYFFIRRRKER